MAPILGKVPLGLNRPPFLHSSDFRSSTIMRATIAIFFFLTHLLVDTSALLNSACSPLTCGGAWPFEQRPMCCFGIDLCLFPSTVWTWIGCTCGDCNPDPEPTSGKCCKYSGWNPYDCQDVELTVGPPDAVDEVCQDINGGSSCYWDYTDPDCCKRAISDGVGNPDFQCDPDGQSGNCCKYTGHIFADCGAIESMAGADVDLRCQSVNMGMSCTWDYSNPDCCERALADGFNSLGVTC